MMKLAGMSFALISVVCGLVPSSVLAQSPAVATFSRDEEGWKGSRGARFVSAPSRDGDGALAFSVTLTGDGWSDVAAESPELSRQNFSAYNQVQASVNVPLGASPGLKGQVFVKTGDEWAISAGSWQPLAPGQWTTLTMSLEEVPNLHKVRSVGIKIGGNSAYEGTAVLDGIEAITRSRSVSPGEAPAPQLTVQIRELVSNSRISGQVIGIPHGKAADYKVVVYVHTDRWYIHPFEQGGADFSFAPINRDGTWQIRTVKREFPADWVAVLVVPRDYAPPSITTAVEQIPHLAIYREEGEGRL